MRVSNCILLEISKYKIYAIKRFSAVSLPVLYKCLKLLLSVFIYKFHFVNN